MGQPLDQIDALIEECAEAGVIFHPKAGQLRPELSSGRPPESLLARVKASREGILLRLAELMDFNENRIEHPPLPEKAASETDAVAEWRKKHATDSK